MPHFWLADGRSLYDVLGADYTLLRFDAGILMNELVTVAEAKGLPLQVIDLNSVDVLPELADVIKHKLILVRPDQHVAWRGDRFGGDEAKIVERLCGGKI